MGRGLLPREINPVLDTLLAIQGNTWHMNFLLGAYGIDSTLGMIYISRAQTSEHITLAYLILSHGEGSRETPLGTATATEDLRTGPEVHIRNDDALLSFSHLSTLLHQIAYLH